MNRLSREKRAQIVALRDEGEISGCADCAVRADEALTVALRVRANAMIAQLGSMGQA